MKFIRKPPVRALVLLLTLAAFAFLAGCDSGSVDSTSANLSNDDGTTYNFSGLYMHSDNDSSTNGVLPIVYPYEGSQKPTGQLITSLRLLQYGSVLEGYDSAGMTWSGSIGSLLGTTASFSLSGKTTAGSSVEMAGTMNYADQQSTLNATWIEPAYYGSIIATATVTPANTNSPTITLSVDASPDSLFTGETSTLTATSGYDSYNWSESSTNASLSSSTGNPVSLTRNSGSSSESVTVSVSAGGETASVTVQFD